MKKFLWLLIQNFISQYLGNKLKKKGILLYLKIVQGARKSVAGLILFIVIMQMMFLGFAAAATCAFFLWPEEIQTKLWVFFTIGALMFAIPGLAMIFLLSERLWYKASGAEKMIHDTLQS